MGCRRMVFAALALVACRGSADGPAGVPTFELREHSRIGIVEGAGAALASVVGVLPHDSTILILESSPPRLASFNVAGQWLRDLAGPGDGPGELRRPSLLGMLGGNVWVGDPMGGRLELLSPDGVALRSYRWDVPPDSLGVRAFPTAPLSDGSILAGPGALSISGPAGGRVTHRSYLRTTEDGKVLGTLYRESLAPNDFVSAALPGGRYLVGMHPIRESPLVAVYPDGSGLVAVERQEPAGPSDASYRIMVVGPGGAVDLDRRVPFEPVSAAGWMDHRLAEMERDMLSSTGTVNQEILTAFREGWTDRRYYPPVSEVVAGADGSIWIRREDPRADSVRWQVFGREGEELGQLWAPAGLTLRWATLERAWGIVKDDFDVPFVVGLDVTRRDAPGPE